MALVNAPVAVVVEAVAELREAWAHQDLVVVAVPRARRDPIAISVLFAGGQ